MDSILVQRVKVDEFITFIKKLLPIDKFIYLKLNNERVLSNCFLPERDAVKLQTVNVSEIFESDSMPSEYIKMSFLNGSHTIEALKHFTGLQVSAEISIRNLNGEVVADNIKLISDELTIDLPCADPSLGFQDMTEEQISGVFSTSGSEFNFEVQPHNLDKLKSLFSLEKERETWSVSVNTSGVYFKGNSYNSLVSSEVQGPEHDAMFYKKYISLLDKESYVVHICSNKAVWQSLDSDTRLTIAICQGA